MATSSNVKPTLFAQLSSDDHLPAVAEEGSLEFCAGDVVVVPVDTSDRSERVFEWYVDNVHQPSNRVIVIYVAEVQRAASSELRVEVLNNSVESKKERRISFDVSRVEFMREKYEAKMKAAGFNESCQFTCCPSSRPGETIVTFAADQDADFIVIGTRGLGKLRLALSGGGVSEFVTRYANCPVIVCRDVK